MFLKGYDEATSNFYQTTKKRKKRIGLNPKEVTK
jgi:hypothetical protein